MAVAATTQPCLTLANNNRELRVEMVNGESRITISDNVRGARSLDYRFGIGSGQHAIVTFDTDHPGNHFDLAAPGRPGEAFFVGSRDGDRFEGDLTEVGNYTIHVYLTADAAQRNDAAHFTIQVHMTPTGP
ncbi:MAG TPA: hypothetical protein VG742_23145 [Dongiaceae bacterium]|nr:hypothetical protein [Dongiaceae bacterium]